MHDCKHEVSSKTLLLRHCAKDDINVMIVNVMISYRPDEDARVTIQEYIYHCVGECFKDLHVCTYIHMRILV